MAQFWVNNVDGWPRNGWLGVWDDQKQAYCSIKDGDAYWQMPGSSGLRRSPQPEELGDELQIEIPPPAEGMNEPDFSKIEQLPPFILDPTNNVSQPSQAGEIEDGSLDGDTDPEPEPSVDFSRTFQTDVKELELDSKPEPKKIEIPLPNWRDDPVARYRTVTNGIKKHSPRAPKNPFKKVFWEYWATRGLLLVCLVFWFCYRKVGNGLSFLYNGLWDLRNGAVTRGAVVVALIILALIGVGISIYATYDRSPAPQKQTKVFSGKKLNPSKGMRKPPMAKPKIKRAAPAKPKPTMHRPQPAMPPVMTLPPLPMDPDVTPDPTPEPMDMYPDPPPGMRKRRRRTRRKRTRKRKVMGFDYRQLLK